MTFIPVDVSTHKSRYDEFYFVEGSGVGQINFPYSGQYIYTISEQPSGSGNLDPALAYNVVENGEAQIIVQSAITVDSQYDIFISNDEFDSNIIFAPDEPNPTPNITPSPTTTPNNPSPTPTPSITPTITPTTTSTPTLTPTPSSTPVAGQSPSQLGALWWVDYADVSTLNLNNAFIPPQVESAKDLISNNYIFSAQTGAGPTYSGTGYYNLSGAVQGGGNGLTNALGTYMNGISAYTTFHNVMKLTTTSQGNICVSDNTTNFSGGTMGYRWFSVDGFLGGNPQYRTYTFYTNGGSVNPEPRTDDVIPLEYNFLATRVYMSGGEPIVEIWLNGVIEDDITNSGSVIITAVNPIFQVGSQSNEIFMTEQYFFDRALSDLEMQQSFAYLTAKYPLQ